MPSPALPPSQLCDDLRRVLHRAVTAGQAAACAILWGRQEDQLVPGQNIQVRPALVSTQLRAKLRPVRNHHDSCVAATATLTVSTTTAVTPAAAAKIVRAPLAAFTVDAASAVATEPSVATAALAIAAAPVAVAVAAARRDRLRRELRRLPQLRRRRLRMRPQRRWAFAGSLHHYRLQRFRRSQCPHEQHRVRLPVCRRRRLHRVRVPDPWSRIRNYLSGSLRELEKGRRRKQRRVPAEAGQG